MRNLALAMSKLGRGPEAERTIYRAIRLQPNNADLTYVRGNILAAEGRVADAIAAYCDAIRLNGGHADAWYNRGSFGVVWGSTKRQQTTRRRC